MSCCIDSIVIGTPKANEANVMIPITVTLSSTVSQQTKDALFVDQNLQYVDVVHMRTVKYHSDLRDDTLRKSIMRIIHRVEDIEHGTANMPVDDQYSLSGKSWDFNTDNLV